MRERETDVPGAAGGTATGVSHDARAPGPVQDVERGPRRWWTGRVRGGRDPGSRDRTQEHGTNGTARRVVLGHQPLEELSNTVPDSFKSTAARSLVLGRPVAGAPEQEAARGGVRRRRDPVDQAPKTGRSDDARAHAELVAGRARGASEARAPAGQHEACLEAVGRAGRLDLLRDEAEYLVRTGLDDLGDVTAGHAAARGPPPPGAPGGP